MDEKIIKFLKIIQEGRDRKGTVHYSEPDNLPKSYNKKNLRYYQKLGLIGWEGKVIHLTPLGYQTLNSAYSLEVSKLSHQVNQESLKHTKTMKLLTIAILLLTALNGILVGVKIFKT